MIRRVYDCQLVLILTVAVLGLTVLGFWAAVCLLALAWIGPAVVAAGLDTYRERQIRMPRSVGQRSAA